MKSRRITASACAILLCSGALADNKREADAHQHGHGALNIALEGETLSIEVETPGADILGFEHDAETAEDKATVQKAREILADPIALFGLTDAADCSVTEVEIEIGGDETDHDEHGEEHAHDDDHDHGDEHAEEEKHDHGDDHAHDHGEEHSEVHAHYTLNCTQPDALGGIDLRAFFEAFPNSEELDAAVLTEAGQASGEITPASPSLSF